MGDEYTDFNVLATKSVGELRVVLEGAGRAGRVHVGDLAAMKAPVVYLKSNASTAGRSLVVTLCSMMLSFLDEVDGLDDGVVEIVDAYARVFELILERGVGGDGQEFGQQIQVELGLAQKRYFIKNPG